MLTGEATGLGELALAGRHGESRRNCIAQAILSVPLIDQSQTVFVARFRVVPEFLRAVLVHQYLARYQAHVDS